MKRLATILMFCLAMFTVTSSASAADIQKSGKQVFPGKMMFTVHPVGVQAGFNFGSVGGYKLSADFAGMLTSFQNNNLGLWLGGAFNYTAGLYTCFALTTVGCGHDLQFNVYVMLTLNLFDKIPLVPWVKAGFVGDALIFGTGTAGGFGGRVGGGIDYWLLKNIGLGVQTNVHFGGAFGLAGVAGFYGAWDFLLGGKFVF